MSLRRSTSLSDLKGAGAGFEDTMFPEGLELVHPRYAIERRNGWMLERSDYFVTYGASRLRRRGKVRRVGREAGEVDDTIVTNVFFQVYSSAQNDTAQLWSAYSSAREKRYPKREAVLKLLENM